MGSLTSWLTGFGAWNWLILGALLLAVEAAAPGLHIVWFGLAALLVGLIALAVMARRLRIAEFDEAVSDVQVRVRKLLRRS